jgi:protein-tyrosine-phosphatase
VTDTDDYVRPLRRPTRRPLRVLFLCTRNAARSQMAEALLKRKGRGQFEAASAGSHPAREVHPLTVEVLRELGIDWTGRVPKGIDAVCSERWDLVITVCDRAKEMCPSFPGQPIFAHWGMEDPAEVFGDEERRRRAFQETVQYLARRIDLLLALPMETLERRALEQRVQEIGRDESVEAEPWRE